MTREELIKKHGLIKPGKRSLRFYCKNLEEEIRLRHKLIKAPPTEEQLRIRARHKLIKPTAPYLNPEEGLNRIGIRNKLIEP